MAVLVLLAVACSDDGGSEADGAGDAPPSTEAPATDPSDDDASTTTTADGGGVGTVEVDGETYDLDEIIGITSCDLEDPEGDLTVAAESADGEVFLRLDHVADNPDSDELSVNVGEVEYVSASAEAVDFEVEDRTVSGTVAVEPLFEEGTAQDVTFEVTCP